MKNLKIITIGTILLLSITGIPIKK